MSHQSDETSRGTKGVEDNMATIDTVIPAIDEKRLGVLGKDPTVPSAGEINLKPELISTWDFWLRSGLPKEEKEELLNKYPWKGNIFLDAPEVNPVMLLSMGELSVRREEHFKNSQRLAGSALLALGQGINLLLDNSDE